MVKMDKAIDLKESKMAMRDMMGLFEKELAQTPGAKFGDDAAPLKHHFGDEIYVREMFAPAGHLIVTKIHKLAHPYFLLKGEVSVVTEEGLVKVTAPHWAMTPAGTKRVCYVHTDTLWITVHPNPTDTQDLEEIENKVIAKTFDEVLEYRNQTRKVIAAEKFGFWSDWTDEQKQLYISRDWEAFSKSRGYSKKNIDDFREWLKQKEELGVEIINDLATKAALKNITEDRYGEFSKSSHIPKQGEKL